MSDLCTDNRFELIEKYKQKLIDSTNIETAQDEMAVIDNILFRFWQMRWLYKLDADAVSVVRCRDCKWWGDLDPKNRYTDCYCHVVECCTESDWFCADGERKDDV